MAGRGRTKNRPLAARRLGSGRGGGYSLQVAPPSASGAPYASFRVLQPLVAYLGERGLDPEQLCSQAGLPDGICDQPDQRIEHDRVLAFWQLAYARAQDPAFGLHVSEHVTLEAFDELIYLASTSETRLAGFESAVGAIRLVHDTIQISMDLEGDLAVVSFRVPGQPEFPSSLNEFAIGTILTLSEMIHREPLELEAWFTHDEPAHRSEYDRVLGIPVRFGAPRTAVAGPVHSLQRRLPGADSALANLLERQVQSLLSGLPQGDRFSDRVRHRIAEGLGVGEIDAETLAAAFRMSPRTLRRRLSDEGTSHKQLVDDVRSELARDYLSNRGLSVDEVTFLVGFSDSSAFAKAFRRWTGKSPTEYLALVRHRR